jgi:hypothetical protein
MRISVHFRRERPQPYLPVALCALLYVAGPLFSLSSLAAGLPDPPDRTHAFSVRRHIGNATPGMCCPFPSHFEGGLTLIRAAESATVLADIVRS